MAGAVACCLPAGLDSKQLLADNWISKAAEAAEAAVAASTAAPAMFNPADPQYNELARRLSKSSAMHKLQQLQQAVVQQEKQLQGLAGDAKEAKKAELEESQQQLTEAQAALSELQASFEQDPLSLSPWMNSLFALADSGCRTFDTGGAVDLAHPAPQVPLMELLAAPTAAAGGPAGVSAWLYRGAEKVLGAFKRRYKLERGPGLLRVTSRLALSPFGGATAEALAAAAEAGLEATRQALMGPEGAAAGALLDTVMLHWLDYEDLGSFVAVLLALKKLLAPPGYDPQAPQEGAADGVAPKLAALGLVQPTAAAVTAAVRAGIPLSCVSLPFNLLDTSAAPLVALCKQQGITVYAAAPTAHGLISSTCLGTAAPNTAAAGGAAAVAGCDNLAAGLDMVARYGGWPRFQELLRVLQNVAERHSTSLQCVALAWLQQQGLVPLLPAQWGTAAAAAAAAGASSTQAGAPWADTLGLQHYRLDLPPLPGAVALTEAAPHTATPTALTADAEAAADGAEGAATEGEGAVGEGGAPAQAEGGDELQAPAAAAAVVVAAVVEKGVGVKGVVGGSAAGSWVASLGSLLVKEDLDALAAVAGRPVSSAAA